MNPLRIALPSVLALAIAGCAGLQRDARGSGAPPPMAASASVVVREAFLGAPRPGDELDSLATWIDAEGATRVIATAKSTHRLVIFDGDTGAHLGEAGSHGRGPGQFSRPNGIAAFGDLLFVTERDAPRVQVLALPGFTHLASFGDEELRSPYGIWVHETAPGTLEAFVTDSFMEGADHRTVPPAAELDRRVHHYRVGSDGDGDGVHAVHLGAFGATGGNGVLHMVESIAGDPARQRLLIADEDTRHGSTLHEYGFDGRYTGRSLPMGTFTGEAEGVALWDCGADAGYWLAADQTLPQTGFHLFDRSTLAPRGSFRGEVTANTDGIALHAAATPRFQAGVLYAVHDDRALAAFDLAEVIRALDLDPACAH